MMKRLLFGVLTLSVLLFVLVGCAGETPEPAADTTPGAETEPTTANDAYPAAADDAYPAASDEAYPAASDTDAYPATTDAYPSPEADASAPDAELSATAEPFIVPTPSSGEVGNVTGKLLRLTDDGGTEPFTPAILYLGTILTSSEGIEGLVELDKQIAPRAEPDAAGNFVFVDVEPGRYGLMLDTPRAALLLKQPDGESDLIVEVVGGEVTDLGELSYDIEGF